MKNQVIKFLREKDYRFIKNIGQGGTGKTILLKDESIDENFVCKKYSPILEQHKDLYFKNFIDEIKIMHKLYHINIVRVFNYYLYPEHQTGYILMEYIQGQNITEFIKSNPHKLNEIFEQTINGFRYLAEYHILHRDIRPDNILVTEDGLIKIIDFGFGKTFKFDKNFEKSITLNWRYKPPKDFKENIYDFRTEVYFVGKLFEEIISDFQLDGFKYSQILLKMIKNNYKDRLQSFLAVDRKIISEDSVSIEFSENEKNNYQSFANEITSLISSIEYGSDYKSDIDMILMQLEEIYKNTMLEEYMQNPYLVVRCIINGNYRYWRNKSFEVIILKNFIKFLKSLSAGKRKIVLNHLWQRLDSITRTSPEVTDDDVPF